MSVKLLKWPLGRQQEADIKLQTTILDMQEEGITSYTIGNLIDYLATPTRKLFWSWSLDGKISGIVIYEDDKKVYEWLRFDRRTVDDLPNEELSSRTLRTMNKVVDKVSYEIDTSIGPPSFWVVGNGWHALDVWVHPNDRKKDKDGK